MTERLPRAGHRLPVISMRWPRTPLVNPHGFLPAGRASILRRVSPGPTLRGCLAGNEREGSCWNAFRARKDGSRCSTRCADSSSSTAIPRSPTSSRPRCNCGSTGREFRSSRRASEEATSISHGTVVVYVGNDEIARVAAGMHVGEIALLEPFKGRSATVIAGDALVVAALVTQQRFSEVARFHPELWRRLAMELARRLVNA